uniref:Uncharacterized protein n=1 Tax=Alexandrium monilatum TaxID=311494 RepID=A0A7S4V3K5_9DINO
MGRRGAPGSADSERISRSIAIFGRYPNKRPSGLRVDDEGCFGLKDLMRTWGDKEGLTEETILSAVRENMFHEEGGALRFAIGENPDGSIFIRVLPKRGHQQQRACATPARAPWQPSGKQWQSRPQQQGSRGSGGGSWGGAAPKHVPPPKLTPAPGLRGSVAVAVAAAADKLQAAREAPLQERLEMALDEMIDKSGKKDKLEMPLEDVIRSEDVEMKDAQSPVKQASSPDGSNGKSGWGKRSEQKPGGGNWDGGWNWNAAESWSKRRGRNRRGQQSWGWREDGWQQSRRDGGEDGGGAEAWRGRDNSRARSSSSGSRSRSRSWRRQRGRRVEGDSEEDTQCGKPHGRAPPRPPGLYWTQYRDDGLLWWYYEGPLGRWFCANAKEDPTPYEPGEPDS